MLLTTRSRTERKARKDDAQAERLLAFPDEFSRYRRIVAEAEVLRRLRFPRANADSSLRSE
jgi:hypothetical protein